MWKPKVYSAAFIYKLVLKDIARGVLFDNWNYTMVWYDSRWDEKENKP